MRKRTLGSLTLVLVSAGLALAQPSSPGEILEQNSLPAETRNAFDPDEPEPKSFCYATGEFLWWWISNTPQPGVLVSTSNDSTGVLGSPGTQVLFGGSDFENAERFGGRATLGYWFQFEKSMGAEVSFFALGDRESTFGIRSDATGSPTIARPVVNALTGRETALFVSLKDNFLGDVAGTMKSGLFGGEINFFYAPFNRNRELPEFFLGFRYLNLDEDLDIGQRTTILKSGLAAFNGNLLASGDQLNIHDRFGVLNEFMGGQIGLRNQVDRGYVFLNTMAGIAFGTTRQSLQIEGSTTHIDGFSGNAIGSVPAGLLALATNSGDSNRNAFSVVPEVRVTAGLYLTPNCQLTVGYNFLYWTDVIRVGSEVNRSINPTQLPTSLSYGAPVGPASPSAQFDQRNLMINGLNFGLSCRF